MDDIQQLKLLAGIGNRAVMQEYKGFAGSNISVTGNEKGELMKKHDIRPGTDEWFRLWFSLPYLTNTSPLDPKFLK
ncbi:hypothetical protein UFOVP257_47 [uncultured Caudovirales phage]|uniref:Uncharacterized protein n=1 Tax=uncultured Caudovirales phage TaxID=2100421 RepID=A0A6J5LET9_9CAUD|nr:hypothetical protein UFOVP257_47 [uncultured Caudovirales phage]